MPPTPDDMPSPLGRAVVMLLLILAVCGLGLVTLCGGVFTVAGMGGGEYSDGIWIISLPSLLIGGWLFYLCARQLRRMWQAAPPQPAGDDH